MTTRSPFQRFAAELRRRHVPQTGAVYAVAAWAAIQFADVVVPNLDWPQWVVEAVIIASVAGLPVVLVLAWFLEWGPEGVHRTSPSEEDGQARSDVATTGAGTPRSAATPGPGFAPSRTAWVATVWVLAVGIVGALVVGVVVVRGGGEQADATAQEESAPTRFERRHADRTGLPTIPDLDEIMGPGYGDSLSRVVNDSIRRELGEGQDLDAIVEMATRIGAALGTAGTDGPIVITRPAPWRFGSPQPVQVGDTLRVQGVVRAEEGVVMVELAGRVVARSEDAPPELPFEGQWVAGSTTGPFRIPLTVRTADGQRIVREFPVMVIPRGN